MEYLQNLTKAFPFIRQAEAGDVPETVSEPSDSLGSLAKTFEEANVSPETNSSLETMSSQENFGEIGPGIALKKDSETEAQPETEESLASCGTAVEKPSLQPGDIMIKAGEEAHAAVFLGWEDDKTMMIIHESSTLSGNVIISTAKGDWTHYRKLID